MEKRLELTAHVLADKETSVVRVAHHQAVARQRQKLVADFGVAMHIAWARHMPDNREFCGRATNQVHRPKFKREKGKDPSTEVYKVNRQDKGLLHACLSACWPTALVLPLCPLPLPCVSSGLLVLPDAVCTARSCQHRLLVKLGAERH